LRRFSNKKPAEAKRTRQAKTDASNFRAIACFPHAKSLSGRDLFKFDIKSSINEELKERRDRGELRNCDQPAAFQGILRRRWDGLTQEERDGWDARANAIDTEEFPNGVNTVYQYAVHAR
jgi:hypothetical protein